MNAVVSNISTARGKPLRIAQVAPLIESVPPAKYGGTERVVYVLSEELVARGHEVTLFASGDSMTSARLHSVVPRALRSDPSCETQLPYLILQLEQVIQESAAFDVIHFHEPFLNYIAARHCLPPTVTTMHGRLDLPDYAALQRAFLELPLVSISYAQRKPMPWVNWIDNIYHGYDPALMTFSPSHAGYLVFLGRIAPEKRPDRAIEIALGADCPLKIAAKVDREHQCYFDSVIRPFLKHPLVQFLGEINDIGKQRLLGGALGTLLPIDWPEPFGLTMIESMACGTPTIAFDAGAVPEILEHGVTGYIVNDVRSAVDHVHRLEQLERARIRCEFEQRFTAQRMVDQYCAIYEFLASSAREAALA